jgi:release factor glutamine methyltransferase
VSRVAEILDTTGESDGFKTHNKMKGGIKYRPTTATSIGDDDDNDEDEDEEDDGDDYQQRSFNRDDDWDEMWKEWNEIATLRTKSQCTPAVVPSMDTLQLSDFQHVYEPSDDTYLLLDAIQYEFHRQMKQQPQLSTNINDKDSLFLQRNNSRTQPSNTTLKVIEIGCGSGVISVYFMKQWEILNRLSQNSQPAHDKRRGYTDSRHWCNFRNLSVWATDINPVALEVASRLASSHGINNQRYQSSVAAVDRERIDDAAQLFLVQCDIATSLLPRWTGQIDVIICNPPYVATPDEEVVDVRNNDIFIDDVTEQQHDPMQNKNIIAAAWAGGYEGRRVIDRILPQMLQLLRPVTGMAYLVTVDDNRPCDYARQLQIETCKSKNSSIGNDELCGYWKMQPYFRRRAQNEMLTVQRITWSTNDV